MHDSKVVILTGANNGIGLFMTHTLLEDGHRVAAIDLSGENLDGIRSSYPNRMLFYPCDVTDKLLVDATVESIFKEWERIDVLVNNACLAVFSPFEGRDDTDTHREFEVNYFGYIHMIRAVLPLMKNQGFGAIHNVSSSVGISGFPGIHGYASTKGAIEALTRTLAIEFEPYGIIVNLMHPPLTNTRSASPLGVPVQVMDDPEDVGRKLAKKVGSKKSIITPDFKTSVALSVSRHFPEAVGKMMAKMTARAKTQTETEVVQVEQ